MSRSIPLLASALILCGALTMPARADLTITLGGATVAPGNTGTIDLSITSDAADTLSSFQFKLLITPEPSATSLLQFTTAQPDPTGNPNYVFAGQSADADLGIPVVKPPLETNYPNDTITGGDQDDNSGLGYVIIPATTGLPNSYLATVQFQAAMGATPGDMFQVSVVPGNLTEFDDENGTPLKYTSNVGIVTVGAAVPEPSSLTMVAISGLAGLAWRRRARSRLAVRPT